MQMLTLPQVFCDIRISLSREESFVMCLLSIPCVPGIILGPEVPTMVKMSTLAGSYTF